MSSQPIKRYAPPPPPPPWFSLSLPRSRSHHHCCSFDLIPLTSADLSKRGKRDGGKGKAYYPSSSALNYLNANDVRGQERGGEENDDGRKTPRGNGKGSARACWQERTRCSGGGLICCCPGSPGAVWLFWKQVSWGEKPGILCADPPSPGSKHLISAPHFHPSASDTPTPTLLASSALIFYLLSPSYWLKHGGKRVCHAAESDVL